MKREEKLELHGQELSFYLERHFGIKDPIPDYYLLPLAERVAARRRAHSMALRHWHVWLAILVALSTAWLGGWVWPLPFVAGMGAAWVFGHHKLICLKQEVTRRLQHEHP